MTPEIALLLGLLLLALVFFSFEWVSADIVGLGFLIALILTGLLKPDDAFASFGSDTVIMILSLLIMTSALIKTGVVDLVGRSILGLVGRKTNLLLLVIMLSCAMLSAFISNTAAAAFFLPVALGLAAKSKISPSRLLMPIAFACILTSSVTLVSTSTNLVVSGLMKTAGMEPMGMFELAPVGIPIALAGLAYMYFIGRHLIPDREVGGGLLDSFGIRSYLTEVLILPKSPLVGKQLGKARFGHELDLTVVQILREPNLRIFPRSEEILQSGDVLLVEGAQENVLKIKDTAGIDIRPDVALSDPDLRSGEASLAEALVVPGSALSGRTLHGLGFRERYGLQVLGINRHGRNLVEKLSRTKLKVGDVLLIQGRKHSIAELARQGLVSVLNALSENRPNRSRALRAIIIFFSSLVLAASGVVPLAVATLLGAFFIFVTRCIPPGTAYRELEWRAVILIACMLALGKAMSSTGTAQYLADYVAALTQGLSPHWILGGFFLLTVVLTQPMSNQAAAAVVLPIAVHTATQLGLNPRAFAVMIAVAASCSYLTPLEPACLMVYGAGRYRFTDFIRVGAPLVLVLFAIAMYLVPIYWPLVAAE
ncbi:MAG TPA: SLC13 family permease [Opitutaceae bacterium]|nr:SLC13 family permease [Opitutaceae bacterium]